jgi:hypothetical protein
VIRCSDRAFFFGGTWLTTSFELACSRPGSSSSPLTTLTAGPFAVADCTASTTLRRLSDALRVISDVVFTSSTGFGAASAFGSARFMPLKDLLLARVCLGVCAGSDDVATSPEFSAKDCDSLLGDERPWWGAVDKTVGALAVREEAGVRTAGAIESMEFPKRSSLVESPCVLAPESGRSSTCVGSTRVGTSEVAIS